MKTRNSLGSKLKPVSTAGLILDEFIRSGKPIVKIPKDNISDKYKNSNACARALGRVIKTIKLENVEAYADVNDDIWIEKTE